jgi:hypothetical protein
MGKKLLFSGEKPLQTLSKPCNFTLDFFPLPYFIIPDKTHIN